MGLSIAQAKKIYRQCKRFWIGGGCERVLMHQRLIWVRGFLTPSQLQDFNTSLFCWFRYSDWGEHMKKRNEPVRGYGFEIMAIHALSDIRDGGRLPIKTIETQRISEVKKEHGDITINHDGRWISAKATGKTYSTTGKPKPTWDYCENGLAYVFQYNSTWQIECVRIVELEPEIEDLPF